MVCIVRIKCVIRGCYTFNDVGKHEIGDTFQTMVGEATEQNKYAVAVHGESRLFLVTIYYIVTRGNSGTGVIPAIGFTIH